MIRRRAMNCSAAGVTIARYHSCMLTKAKRKPMTGTRNSREKIPLFREIMGIKGSGKTEAGAGGNYALTSGLSNSTEKDLHLRVNRIVSVEVKKNEHKLGGRSLNPVASTSTYPCRTCSINPAAENFNGR